MISLIDYYLRDSSRGFARIQLGQVPDGSGNPIGGNGVLTDYFFLPGRSPGQIAYFSNASGGGGTLGSNPTGSKGKILLGASSAYDEANVRLGLFTQSPAATLHIVGSGSTTNSRPSATSGGIGNWRGQDAGSTNLQNYVNETSLSESTYVTEATGSVGTAITWVFWTAGNIPFSGSPTITITFRTRRDPTRGNAGTEFLQFTLYRAAVTVTAQASATTFTTAWADYSYTLTAGQVSSLYNAGADGCTMDTSTGGIGGPGGYDVAQVTMAISTGTGDDIARWDVFGGTRAGRITSAGRIDLGDFSGTSYYSLIPGDDLVVQDGAGLNLLTVRDRIAVTDNSWSDTVAGYQMMVGNANPVGGLRNLMISGFSNSGSNFDRLGIMAVGITLWNSTAVTMPPPTAILDIHNAVAARVMSKLVPHASQSVDLFQARNSADSLTNTGINKDGSLILNERAILAQTTDSTHGVIYQTASSTSRLIHSYTPQTALDYTAAPNLFFGIEAGNFSITDSGLDGSGGFGNLGFGGSALASLEEGYENLAFGYQALYQCSNGGGNVAIGKSSCAILLTGSANLAVGSNSLGSCITGSLNVAIGTQALSAISAGSGNIGIGTGAGSTMVDTSNALIIDTQSRVGTTDTQTGAILFGGMGATPGAQTLRLNAAVTVSESLNLVSDNDEVIFDNDEVVLAA